MLNHYDNVWSLTNHYTKDILHTYHCVLSINDLYLGVFFLNTTNKQKQFLKEYNDLDELYLHCIFPISNIPVLSIYQSYMIF